MGIVLVLRDRRRYLCDHRRAGKVATEVTRMMTTGTKIESAIGYDPSTLAASLAEDRLEAVEHGEWVAGIGAEATCKRIAMEISAVLGTPGIRWVVFGEPYGRVVLVVRSDRRRADFRIGRNGNFIRAVRVDENMEVTVDRLASEQHDQLRQIAEWVGGSKMP